jgi:hypothetical protein
MTPSDTPGDPNAPQDGEPAPAPQQPPIQTDPGDEDAPKPEAPPQTETQPSQR